MGICLGHFSWVSSLYTSHSPPAKTSRLDSVCHSHSNGGSAVSARGDMVSLGAGPPSLLPPNSDQNKSYG